MLATIRRFRLNKEDHQELEVGVKMQSGYIYMYMECFHIFDILHYCYAWNNNFLKLLMIMKLRLCYIIVMHGICIHIIVMSFNKSYY